MVKFWDPATTYAKLKPEIDEAIQRVLSSGKLVLGYNEDIEEFEKKFAEFMGTKHAVMCGGGTHALKLAYKALGIGPGDEVITVSHTFIATIDQIVDCGATPILVDIGEDGLMDPEEVKKAITPKTKAIVPVHLEGKVANVDELLKFGIPVIEDAAQAVGARVGGGVMQCYSFFPAKILGSIGNAGAVTTNDDVLAERLRMLRCNSNIGKNPDLNAEYGVQLEPDGIQAAVLNVKMEYLDSYLLTRDAIASKYYEGLSGLPITLPYRQEGRVYQDFVIRVKEGRGELVKHLQDNGIGILGYNLIPNHHYPNLKLNFNLPRTDAYIAEQIRIPCNPDLTSDEVEEVIRVIRNFYE